MEGVVERPLVVPRLLPLLQQQPTPALHRGRVHLPVVRLPDAPLPARGELVDLQHLRQVQLVGGAVEPLEVRLVGVEQLVQAHALERLSGVDEGAVLEARQLQLEAGAGNERAEEARPRPLFERALDEALLEAG